MSFRYVAVGLALLLSVAGFPLAHAQVGSGASDPPGLSEGVMLRLERAAWIESGSQASTSIVYVFVDMECPYCRGLYEQIRAANPPVRVRYLPVAVLQPSSWTKAAAVLQAPDPAAALDRHERNPRGVDPAAVSAETRKSLELNNLFMDALNIPATPGIVYRDAGGAIRSFTGVPDAPLLAAILRRSSQ